jgi:hypothetical protein
MAINSLSTGFRPGVCTSSTRPTAPYEGQQIYETDTDFLYVWNGSAWRQIPSAATAGTILQVKQTVITVNPSSTNSSPVDITNMNVSITPQSTSSKILVTVNMSLGFDTGTDDVNVYLLRGSTAISIGTNGTTMSSAYLRGNIFGDLGTVPVAINFIDSPNTTSATTYKMQWQTRVGRIYLNRRGADSAFSTSSSITVMEISG